MKEAMPLKDTSYLLARITWITSTILALATLSFAGPILFAQGHQHCHQASCNGPQLTSAQLHSLHASGLSLDFYAGYMTGLEVVFVVVYCAVAVLIFLHRSRDRVAFLSALFLVIFGGLSFPGTLDTIAQAHPAFHIPAGIVKLLGAMLLSLFFYLFPDGRFVPSWTRYAVPLLPLIQAPDALFPHSAFTLERLPLPIGIGGFLGSLGLMIYAQVYRYRRASNAVQRQQTKWVVFGMGVGMAGFMILVFGGIFLPAALSQGIIADLAVQTGFYAFMLLIPLTIAIAVLRYRLFDVDVLINRTLVYGALTASLLGLYIGGVIGLQALFRMISGQSSDIAVAIATLGVAALFNPWRHRLQTFIDRRFYRRRYDAARVLTSFQAKLRGEVDLDQLSGEIISVVQETLQPSAAALWLVSEDSGQGVSR